MFNTVYCTLGMSLFNGCKALTSPNSGNCIANSKGATARWNLKEAGGKHSKEEYDNRIMEANATNITANATNVGAKKEKKQQKKDRFSEKIIIFAK